MHGSDQEEELNGVVTMPQVERNAAIHALAAMNTYPEDPEECSNVRNQGKPIIQKIYSCLDCRTDETHPIGICYSCLINCHTNCSVVEVGIKRNFICDCSSKYSKSCCNLNKDLQNIVNESNHYSHNFDGKFCFCNEQYDPINDTMHECICCEDWFHIRCIGKEIPNNLDNLELYICRNCLTKSKRLWPYLVFNYSRRLNLNGNDFNIDSILLNSEKEEELNLLKPFVFTKFNDKMTIDEEKKFINYQDDYNDEEINENNDELVDIEGSDDNLIVSTNSNTTSENEIESEEGKINQTKYINLFEQDPDTENTKDIIENENYNNDEMLSMFTDIFNSLYNLDELNKNKLKSIENNYKNSKIDKEDGTDTKNKDENNKIGENKEHILETECKLTELNKKLNENMNLEDNNNSNNSIKVFLNAIKENKIDLFLFNGYKKYLCKCKECYDYLNNNNLSLIYEDNDNNIYLENRDKDYDFLISDLNNNYNQNKIDLIANINYDNDNIDIKIDHNSLKRNREFDGDNDKDNDNDNKNKKGKLINDNNNLDINHVLNKIQNKYSEYESKRTIKEFNNIINSYGQEISMNLIKKLNLFINSIKKELEPFRYKIITKKDIDYIMNKVFTDILPNSNYKINNQEDDNDNDF